MMELRRIFPWKFLNVYIGLFFKIPLSCCFWNTPAEKKHVQSDNKGIFHECYSGIFIISLEKIFEVCDGVWSS